MEPLKRFLINLPLCRGKAMVGWSIVAQKPQLGFQQNDCAIFLRLCIPSALADLRLFSCQKSFPFIFFFLGWLPVGSGKR